MNLHKRLEWIADSHDELPDSIMDATKVDKPTWDFAWLNKQLYGILSETSESAEGGRDEEGEGDAHKRRQNLQTLVPRLLGLVEGRFSRSWTESCCTARASQDNSEDRVRAWEEDVERLNRITKSEV